MHCRAHPRRNRVTGVLMDRPRMICMVPFQLSTASFPVWEIRMEKTGDKRATGFHRAGELYLIEAQV